MISMGLNVFSHSSLSISEFQFFYVISLGSGNLYYAQTVSEFSVFCPVYFSL